MREQHRRECLVNDRESTRAAGSGVRSLWRVVPHAVKDRDYGFAAVPAADRIGGGFWSGGGSLTGAGLGGSSGCGGFGGSSMGGGGSFIGDGPLGALLFFETTNKVSPFTTGLFWPCSKRKARSRCMFLRTASWRVASLWSASLIAASSCCLRSSVRFIKTIWGCKASFAQCGPGHLGAGGLRKMYRGRAQPASRTDGCRPA